MTPWAGDAYLDENFVLRNRLRLTSRDALQRAENRIVTARLANLDPGSLPLNAPARLRAIHLQLFGDVYTWAGEYRTVGISKQPDEPFVPPESIPGRLDRLDAELSEHGRAAMAADPFDYLATGFADLNRTHPFREGNGRVQRIFWALFARSHGYEIDWESVTKHESDSAAHASMSGRVAPLHDLFARITRRTDS